MTEETKPMPDEIWADFDDNTFFDAKEYTPDILMMNTCEKYRRADLAQPQGETVEALLAKVPKNCIWWDLVPDQGEYIFRMKYLSIVFGHGKTVSEAIKAALAKVGDKG